MALPPISAAAAALRQQLLGAAQAGLTPSASERQPAGPAAPRQTQPPADSLAAARAAAAARQGGMAPLMADLVRALSAPDLPPQIREAIQTVLRFQVALDPPPSARTLQQAIAGSGLFLEAHAAAKPGAAPADLKAALLALQHLVLQRPQEAPRQAQRRTTPAPPSRGGDLSAQTPAASTLDPAAVGPSILAALAPGLEQALARQILHQLASLPGDNGPAWMVELPVSTAAGAAVAQFEIRRDDPPPDRPEAEPVWRTRFALDIPPLGPVHVHLSLAGERAAVALWAENPVSADLLRNEQAVLHATLPADAVIRQGAPHQPPPAPGRFVDQAT